MSTTWPLEKEYLPTQQQLYEDLWMDYYYEKVVRFFPESLSDLEDYAKIIKLLAWATARSFHQPRILKYIYSPRLCFKWVLPKLADTLGLKYSLNYDLDQLRLLLKNLQRIRRNRGTIKSLQQIIRILCVTEQDVLDESYYEFGSVSIIEPEPGVFELAYWNLPKDTDFLDTMIRLVMPAGYRWYTKETPVIRQFIIPVDKFDYEQLFIPEENQKANILEKWIILRDVISVNVLSDLTK